MDRKRMLPGIGASIGMLILILDGKTALEGARLGIELCLKTVIPSLFPFFVLSMLLTSSLAGISIPFLRPLGYLCRIPKGTESILLSGFLGGYPVGAQCISAAYHNSQLPRVEAERMLAFCSNAGPAFLFGMAAAMFPRKWMAWALWGIHIAGAIFAALLTPGTPSASVRISGGSKPSLSETVQASVRVVASVCGWVILFRVVITFLNRWVLWLAPHTIQVMITGLLELSNGCCELFTIPDIPLRFMLCSGMLAFGGLCVTMQTASVTKGLSLRYYFRGKLLQTLFSLAISGFLMYHVWLPVGFLLLLIRMVHWKNQKNSSIPSAVGV